MIVAAAQWKRYFAESLGTFALVFAGTGAIIINQVSGGAISHAGIALTFGLVVLAMIYTVGDISGAHLNPAVSIGFWAARRLPSSDLGPYILSQLAGAFIASGLLKLLFPDNKLLGATLPAGSEIQSFILETVGFTVIAIAATFESEEPSLALKPCSPAPFVAHP